LKIIADAGSLLHAQTPPQHQLKNHTTMDNDHLLQQIRNKAAIYFENSSGSHDLSHTERVFKLCMKIAACEDADSEIIAIAALLHDVGRNEQDQSKGRICHAESGARIAGVILQELGLSLERIQQVIHCIETHRFRGSKRPLTKEARILFDADKLDSIGAIGIGRAFQFAGEVGAKLHNGGIEIAKTESYSREDTAYREFTVKLSKVKDSMLTQEGRRLARERHRFMVEFFDRLSAEAEGKI
jgi:uncharacterized protein